MHIGQMSSFGGLAIYIISIESYLISGETKNEQLTQVHGMKIH